MFKTLFGLRSPAGPAGRLSILIFHRVLPTQDPIFPEEIDVPTFDRICQWISSWGNVLPLDEAVLKLKSGTLPSRAVSITFDDGYADNFTQALPILKKYQISATFFIATRFLDGGRMWNDTVIESIRNSSVSEVDLSKSADLRTLCLGRFSLSTIEEKRKAINSLIGELKYLPGDRRVAMANEIAEIVQSEVPNNLMMSSANVKELHEQGMQIGAHTCSHPILAGLDHESARSEIADSKIFLERLLGERVRLFAYPNGKPERDYCRESVSIVRELGFDAAVTTAWGAARSGSDIFQLPRFTPWNKVHWKFYLRLLDNLRLPEMAIRANG